MNLDKSTVDVLLNACVNDGVLICAGKRTSQGVWNNVCGASVTDDDANRMEEFLNSTCSDRALTELIDVLEGNEPLDSALREVARLISRNKQDKIDFQTRLAFLRALDDERNSGCPNKEVIKQNEIAAVQSKRNTPALQPKSQDQCCTACPHDDYTLNYSRAFQTNPLSL